jgi:glucose/arabinose dehydrogenase
LRDSDNDGAIDQEVRFFDRGGTGLGLDGGFLYFGAPTEIVRFPIGKEKLGPLGAVESVVSGFPAQSAHNTKSLAIAPGKWLFVNVGAPSNACQKRSRTRGSPGLDPCPQLNRHAGIWRFPLNQLNQRFGGKPYVTGVRNAVALDWDATNQALYTIPHGRDQLHDLWPDRFSEEDSAELPAEELFQVEEGDNLGWPYCYFDHRQNKKVLTPEYGGDGDEVGRCDQFKRPIVGFPGHWAPNDILIYSGTQFPARYKNGAFIAFHGSWNRHPFPQQGYKVVFVAYDEGSKMLGDSWSEFAGGFAGPGPIGSSGDARFRPMGLAEGPDGALYIVDSVKGRVWRVVRAHAME